MLRALSVFLILCALSTSPFAASDKEEQKLAPVKHIIVFYLENHSFDNLFGTFPGVDGIAYAAAAAVQTNAGSTPYAHLPQVMSGKTPDKRFTEKLINKPFLITQYVGANEEIPDPIHRFYQTQQQMNGGKMDRFAAVSNVGALVMGYYEEKNSPLWQYAKRYTLADHFFTAGFGGSMLNHFWLVCACVPQMENAPKALLSILGEHGKLLKDGPLDPDGYVINTIQPSYPLLDKPEEARLPAQAMPTIGDRLNEKGISWGWYAGGWNTAKAGKPAASFQRHHQPFLYFANYAARTPGNEEHLKDETDFVNAIENGQLPAVAFYKPTGDDDLHPGYSKLRDSENHVFALVRKIEESKLWKDSLIIVTFDDTGGFWDHVAPPRIDRFGPGGRVPTLIISPFAKSGFVDHTMYDTTSILKLIETKYGLKPLGERDAKASDLTNALEKH